MDKIFVKQKDNYGNFYLDNQFVINVEQKKLLAIGYNLVKSFDSLKIEDQIKFLFRRKKGKKAILKLCLIKFKEDQCLEDLYIILQMLIDSQIYTKHENFLFQEIVKLTKNVFFKIMTKNAELLEQKFCDLISLLYLNNLGKENKLSSNIENLFWKANLKLGNYQFLFELVHEKIIQQSFLIGYLLCEMGSFRKLFFVHNFVEFEDSISLFQLIDFQHDERFLSLGIQLIVKYLTQTTQNIFQKILFEYLVENFKIREICEYARKHILKKDFIDEAKLLKYSCLNQSNYDKNSTMEFLQMLNSNNSKLSNKQLNYLSHISSFVLSLFV